MTGHSALVVPLDGLPSVVPPLARGALVPHVALVAPFADRDNLDTGMLDELGAYFADVVPFQVGLTHLSQFPGGPAYLAPEPVAPFRHLIQGLAQRFPELLPRPGGFGDVPRVEVPLRATEELTELESELEPWLPAVTLARQAALWWHEDDGVHILATFPFGTTAA